MIYARWLVNFFQLDKIYHFDSNWPVIISRFPEFRTWRPPFKPFFAWTLQIRNLYLVEDFPYLSRIFLASPLQTYNRYFLLGNADNWFQQKMENYLNDSNLWKKFNRFKKSFSRIKWPSLKDSHPHPRSRDNRPHSFIIKGSQ